MSRQLKRNWVQNIATFVNQISMAPKQFHVWSAISVVGAVLKNKVSFKYGTYTLYPNQYIVMVAPPGIGKGESIRYAYERAKTTSGNSSLINLISDRITAPKIIERIAQGTPTAAVLNNQGQIVVGNDSSATLVSLELQTLLTSSDWMLSFLCDAWDRGEYEYDTKNSGSSFIKGMCTSLIGACVPEYIRKLNKDSTAAINSGFTARTLFVYAESTSKRLPWPKSVDDIIGGKVYQDKLEADLEHISSLSGSFTITLGGRQKFENAFSLMEPKETDSDVVAYFKSRMHVHILKTAMVLSAAERDDLVIDETCMINAIACVRVVFDSLDRAFRGVGESDLAEATAKVQFHLEKVTMATRQDILAQLHKNISPETLDRVLSLLLSIGFIETVDVGKFQFFKVRKKIIPNSNGHSGTII